MSKLRNAAKGRDCQLMIYPHCNQNPETVVLCHLPSADKGWALKSPDWWGAWGCSSCHDVIDKRIQTELDQLEIERCMMRGLYRTQKILHEEGLIYD